MLKAIPASTSYLLKKVKFAVKNEEKLLYQTKDYSFLFFNGETRNFWKNKDFSPNTMFNWNTFIFDGGQEFQNTCNYGEAEFYHC